MIFQMNQLDVAGHKNSLEKTNWRVFQINGQDIAGIGEGTHQNF